MKKEHLYLKSKERNILVRKYIIPVKIDQLVKLTLKLILCL